MSIATDSVSPVPPEVTAYLASLGRRGGKSRSPRKLAASRQNVAKATAHRWKAKKEAAA